MSKPTTDDKLINLMTGYAANANGLTLDDASQVADRLQTQAEEIKELKEENARLDKLTDSLAMNLWKTSRKDLATLQSALETYADEAVWGITGISGHSNPHKDLWQIPESGFTLAQEALAKIQGAK